MTKKTTTGVDSIFAEALQIPSASQRDEFLAMACRDDAQLRQRVETLLNAHDQAGSFLAQPVAEFAVHNFAEEDTSRSETNTQFTTASTPHLTPLVFLEPCEKEDRIGRICGYEVLHVIGRGGMGVVLKAVDMKLNRQVAIKVLAPEFAMNATAEQRFLREARAVAAVRHEHVVTIFGVNETHRPPFIAMEFIAGESLQQRIDRFGSLPLIEVLRIGAQAAAGLSAAHEQGLVHRDIKPSNILLEGDQQRVKITDFGLARAIDDLSITNPGQIAGTPQFMSPEQAQGLPIDHRTDLFSLGSVIYAMVAGRAPFSADSIVATLRCVCDEEPVPLLQINPGLPAWFVTIVDRLLVKDPQYRFQSARELAHLLGQCQAHLEQPMRVPPPQIVPPPRTYPPAPVKPAHSQPPGKQSAVVAWTIAATACVLLAAFAGWHIYSSFTQRNEAAEQEAAERNNKAHIDVELPFIKMRADEDGNVDVNAGGLRVKADPKGDVEVKVPGLKLDLKQLKKLIE